LFDQGNARRVLHYVHHFEICNLLPEVNKNRPTKLLGDKQAFYEEATRHHLPIAPIVAAFESGAVLKWHSSPENRLPESDLVLKAFDLSCGARFERWSYSGHGAWSSDGETLDEGQFLDRCRLRSLDHGCLVQKRLVNHPDIAGLGPNGLCTVRVVTYRWPTGDPAILMACLRMPTAGGIVDNFAAGGIAAPVDPHTGAVGEAVAKKLSRGRFRSHPDSRAPIAGVRLPLWAETRSLALDAHRGFDWMPFVGWDIAVTPDGPLLLEANPVWCVDLLQIPHHVALGDTEFVSVFLQHLEGVAEHPLSSGVGASPVHTQR
jgi:Sugar-transfer associated ATP-grasp